MQERTRFFPLLVDEPVVAGPKPSVKKGAETKVDIDRLTRDLTKIKRALVRVYENSDTRTGFGLDSLEIGLTISAEGGISFIAKASVEASITLTFKRNQPAKSG